MTGIPSKTAASAGPRGSISLGVQLLMFGILLAKTYSCIWRLNPAQLANISMDGLAMLVLSFIYSSLIRSKKVRRDTRQFMALIELEIIYLFSDGLFYQIDGIARYHQLNFFLNMVYMITPIIMSYLYWLFVMEWIGDHKRHPVFKGILLGFVVSHCMLVFANVFWRFIYTVSPETGLYTRGSWFWCTYPITVILLLINILYVLYRPLKLRERISFLIYPSIPLLITILTFLNISPIPLCVGTFGTLTYLYCNLYIQRGEELAEREQALTETRLNAMMLQINPHFIYNTLGSVDSLLTEDPEAARHLLGEFSEYLRNNYTDLTRSPLIPLEEEMHHLQQYVAIEKIRFPNIQVNYDMAATDFLLPSLTLQPLVENAIKHGICQRRYHQGTLRISSWETAEAYFVLVRDDGVGFDTRRQPDEDLPHIGIENVRQRLALLCEGELMIDSTPGIGTDCLIRIPRQEEEP